MVTVRLPFRVIGDNGIPSYELKLETVRRSVYLKRTNQFKLFADRRAGKDSWEIFNEVKKQCGADFDRHVFCSPYGGYALLYCRW